jgi:hypothetical protein
MRKAQARARMSRRGKRADEFEELRNFNIPHGFWALGRAFLALLAGNPRSEMLCRENSDQLGDLKLGLLYAVTKNVETKPIELSARLDRIGAQCVGGLHFRLNRANYYVKEFHILVDTPRVGNVPTWVAYDQFVKRGLAPAFDYIEGVGDRLRALRDRLQRDRYDRNQRTGGAVGGDTVQHRGVEADFDLCLGYRDQHGA